LLIVEFLNKFKEERNYKNIRWVAQPGNGGWRLRSDTSPVLF